MKQFFVLLALIGFGLSSCERHTWETKGDPKTSDTINLFLHEEEHPNGEEAQKEGEPAHEGEKAGH